MLVDPDDRRNVAHRVELGEQVVSIEQHRKRDAIGELPNDVRGFIERDGDDGQTRRFELVGQCLPPGQVVAATSPTGEGDQDHHH